MTRKKPDRPYFHSATLTEIENSYSIWNLFDFKYGYKLNETKKKKGGGHGLPVTLASRRKKKYKNKTKDFDIVRSE